MMLIGRWPQPIKTNRNTSINLKTHFSELIFLQITSDFHSHSRASFILMEKSVSQLYHVNYMVHSIWGINYGILKGVSLFQVDYLINIDFLASGYMSACNEEFILEDAGRDSRTALIRSYT